MRHSDQPFLRNKSKENSNASTTQSTNNLKSTDCEGTSSATFPPLLVCLEIIAGHVACDLLRYGPTGSSLRMGLSQGTHG